MNAGYGRRRQRSRAEVEVLLRDYASSGLVQEEFCALRGVARSTLGNYLCRSRMETGASAAQLVAVEVISAKPGEVDGKPRPMVAGDELCGGVAGMEYLGSSGLVVVLGGDRRIEVQPGFDGPTLERLVRTLEEM